MIANTKVCATCGVEKPSSEFHTRTQKGRTYLYHCCKQCSNGRKRERWAAGLLPKPKEHHVQTRIAKVKKQRAEGQNRGRFILEDSRKSDKRKGLVNDLDRAFIDERISNGCSYCGEKEGRMTLDRIDNNVGHLKSNVVPACYRCNLTRRDMPYEAWLVVVSKGMREARELGLFEDWKSGPHQD